MARLDPRQHLLKDGGWNFLGWHMTLLVWAVEESIFLKEPTRAALAVFVPIRVLVKLLPLKISSSCFINEHADFTEVEGILYCRVTINFCYST